MSELASQHNDSFEPDEDILISALRNQDDIPILMDVVAEQVARVSQEDYLVQTLDESIDKDLSAEENEAFKADFSPELVSKAIADVLEKRLPELVSEVMQNLYTSENSEQKE